jgi:hypothetical protein
MSTTVLSTTRTRWIIILLVTATGALWLYLRGPLPVMRGSTPLPGTVPSWYMLTAFPVLGMLVADWVALLATTGLRLPVLELAVQIGLLVALSSLRLKTAILLSGHSLLFAYFILRRLLVLFPGRTIRKVEIALAFVLFCLTSYVKFFWWSDLQTLLFGIFVGAILAFASYSVLRAFNTWPGLRCHNLGTVQFSALVMRSSGRSRIEK